MSPQMAPQVATQVVKKKCLGSVRRYNIPLGSIAISSRPAFLRLVAWLELGVGGFRPGSYRPHLVLYVPVDRKDQELQVRMVE